MSNIKLVGLDLDGTLLRADHTISRRNKQAIQAAIQAGCMVIPATGRPLGGIPGEFLKMQGVNYAVTANGATVFELDEPFLKLWISQHDFFLARDLTEKFDRVMDLFVLGNAYNTASLMEDVQRWAPPSMASYIRMRTQPVPDVMALARTQPGVEKANMFFTDPDQRLEAKALLQATGLFEITSSAVNNLELNAKGVNKGRALLALAEKLGLEPSQVMACGDADNDTVMLQTVGLGVAMGNAMPGVKEAANWVTATNEEDGVALALEKFVLGKHCV